MSKNKKYMIEYLDINERFYIENDIVKMKLREGTTPRDGSWEEMWGMVKEIISKARKYDEENNTD